MWRRPVLAALGAATLVALMLTAFGGSSATVEPRDLPLTVAGPPPAVDAVEQRLEQERPGAFEVTGVPDEVAAREAIADRDVYGAVLAGPDGPERVLVASAASSLAAQVVDQVGTGLGVPVEDVVPAPPADPRGAVFGASALPITVGGVALGTLLALTVPGRARRLGGLLLGASLVGLVVVGLVHGWLDALAGDPAAEVGVVALGVLAVGAVLAGLHSVAGRAGLVAGDLVLILVGNPFSAASAAPELLAEPWSTLGHWLPLGATVDALRGVSGFDGARTALPIAVLTGWALLGSALVVVRRHRPVRPPGARRAEDAHPTDGVAVAGPARPAASRPSPESSSDVPGPGLRRTAQVSPHD